MANAVYWDTSALLKLYAPEPDSSDYALLPFRLAQPFADCLQRRDLSGIALPTAFLHQLPELRVASQEPIDEIGIIRSDRDHLEGRLAVQGDHHRRRRALPRVLFEMVLGLCEINNFHVRGSAM